MGHLVSTTCTPNYVEGSVFGDNKEVEHKKKFKNAAIVMGTTYLPKEADETMFGHATSEDGETRYNTDDKTSYVGYGFISNEVVDGVESSVAVIFTKVMFSEGENAYTTAGDSITFGTNSVNGTAVGNAAGDWIVRKEFASDAEAESHIKTFLGMQEAMAAQQNEQEAQQNEQEAQ